ncbi:hypothetical protein ACLSY8_00005 [Avibacterium avium]
MNKNAPFIREIIDRTQIIKGERVRGNNPKEINVNIQAILKQQVIRTAL